MANKINYMDAKFYWNDIFFFFCNNYFLFRYFTRKGAAGHGLRSNVQLKNKHLDNRSFVVGNGPSVNNQDLKLLKGEVTFFVNRSFLHEDYEYIKPTYHIFVDPKMKTGEWPLTFLDQAAEKNPEVIFLLSGDWYNLPQFKSYKDKYQIFWLSQKLFFSPFFRKKINLVRIGPGGAVVEQGILASIYMGCKEIYFLGVDGNGLCYNLINKPSHFYGSNPEDLRIDFKATYSALDMMASSLRRWDLINKYCRRQGISLMNLTDGGIIDCCNRMDFKNVLAHVG